MTRIYSFQLSERYFVRHPHPVFYCEHCKNAYDPSELPLAYTEIDGFEAVCPGCEASLFAADHEEACADKKAARSRYETAIKNQEEGTA